MVNLIVSSIYSLIVSVSLTTTCCSQQEKQRYEAIEKEYERAAELAREDEVELRLAKKMLPR